MRWKNEKEKETLDNNSMYSEMNGGIGNNIHKIHGLHEEEV
jgi:hypothetical protein